MIINKKQFYIGLIMLIVFTAAFAVMMSPVVNGQTVIQTADNLFNSLTKGSTYHIPKLAQSAEKYKGTPFEVTVGAKSQKEADGLAKVFGTSGAKTEIGSDNKVKISGDLGKTAGVALQDADTLFKNNESQLKGQYGINGPDVVKYWWTGFNALNSKYKKEGNADLMTFVNSVNTKGLEVAYNFDGIQGVKVAERTGTTAFLLCFYIIYTVFYGFAIMYLMEGLGIVASAHGEKAEA